jgi:hypothetical protein
VDHAMVQRNRLVHWVVQCQWLGHLSYMEAVQAGLTGLRRAWLRTTLTGARPSPAMPSRPSPGLSGEP